MQTWLFDRPVLKDFGSFTIVNYGLYFAIGISLFLQGMYVTDLTLGIDVNLDYVLFVGSSYTRLKLA